ncbi:HesB/YadR/YfhF family protein [Fictibacillus iocasae]|uniref:HesB/YadR/YfhF family protein n=1 Tax=Fictibacillus iocasae TaxID=2715437 RepID=A0ABW2NJ93_9BACL
MMMKLYVSKKAAEALKTDLQHSSGNAVRFFVRLGGCSTVQSGFSVGVTKDDPKHPGPVATDEQTGLTFFIEQEDEWFFDNHDLHVEYDEENENLQYEYRK